MDYPSTSLSRICCCYLATEIADTKVIDWFSDADWWLSQGGTGHLLSFNEPDRPDQAAMTPQEAADAYRTYMHPYIGRAQLGSPAISNGGYAWLQDFLGRCSDCHIDFIAAHWYNPWNLQSDFQNWVNAICSLANGRQVWITEVCLQLAHSGGY